jgi:release factor glutamine methyltransferase
MLTLLEVLRRTQRFFMEKGVPQPRLDAELLLAQVLGLRRLDLYLQFERPMAEEELAQLRPLVRRRAGREPLQYILGEVGFRDLVLRVDPRALIPRPETEELVDAILARPPASDTAFAGRILDLGTGSGALALALATARPRARVIATDYAAEPLALARENAEVNGLAERVDFRRGNWWDAVSGSFELIVSNPPYLSRAEAEACEPEILGFEPASALVAAEEGFAALAEIIAGAPRFLSASGLLALETGIDQAEKLRQAANAAGLTAAEVVEDISKRPRFFFARQAPAKP